SLVDEGLEFRLRDGDASAGVKKNLVTWRQNRHARGSLHYRVEGKAADFPTCVGVPHLRRQAVTKCFRCDMAKLPDWDWSTGVSGTSDQDTGQENKEPTDHNLKQCGSQRRVHISVADPRNHG